MRSSPSNGKTACRRSSGVRLARNFVAADAIADDDRSALTPAPAAHAAAQAAANQNRVAVVDLDMCMTTLLLPAGGILA
jgi:hypothetical protein